MSGETSSFLADSVSPTASEFGLFSSHVSPSPWVELAAYVATWKNCTSSVPLRFSSPPVITNNSQGLVIPDPF